MMLLVRSWSLLCRWNSKAPLTTADVYFRRGHTALLERERVERGHVPDQHENGQEHLEKAHSFTAVDGVVTSAGQARIEIGLWTLDTNVDIRDVRMPGDKTSSAYHSSQCPSSHASGSVCAIMNPRPTANSR